jgi:hypothetical protein
MIYVPSFIKIVWGIQNLVQGYTGTRRSDLINTILIFQNKESEVKIPRYTGHMCEYKKWNHIRIDRLLQ